MLRFVTATRRSEEDFKREAPLCRTLDKAALHESFELRVFAANRDPLPFLYNLVIDESDAEDVLVFIHDDVWVDDWLIGARVRDALEHFDVVGVAGSRRRLRRQGLWWWDSEREAGDLAYLSGCIGHGSPFRSSVTHYGPAPSRVVALDGVMLAVRAGTLHRSGVRFDPAFTFHFYDLDFCRTCEQAGLSMGTWPIALTHESPGAGCNTPLWSECFRSYLMKWND